MTPLIIAIRTANRAPKKSYLANTLRAFKLGGCDPCLIHLFPTDPDIAWLDAELGTMPVCVHAPDHARTPNENGIALVSALDCMDAEWILLAEDDISLCDDAMGSMTRWLADHASPNYHVYRMFALPRTPLRKVSRYAAEAPLREMRGSQACALRAEDARLFATWATAHPKDWRPKDAPFQDRPERGFDKLIGYWALQQWPQQPNGLVALPMLVNHAGRESLLHSHGLRNDSQFIGASKAYSVATA